MTVEEGEPTFQVQPSYAQKFKEPEAKDIISNVLKSKLAGAYYHPDNTSTWAKEIADDIKHELKAKEWPRYKYVVHVVIAVRLPATLPQPNGNDSVSKAACNTCSNNNGGSNTNACAPWHLTCCCAS